MKVLPKHRQLEYCHQEPFYTPSKCFFPLLVRREFDLLLTAPLLPVVTGQRRHRENSNIGFL